MRNPSPKMTVLRSTYARVTLTMVGALIVFALYVGAAALWGTPPLSVWMLIGVFASLFVWRTLAIRLEVGVDVLLVVNLFRTIRYKRSSVDRAESGYIPFTAEPILKIVGRGNGVRVTASMGATPAARQSVAEWLRSNGVIELEPTSQYLDDRALYVGSQSALVNCLCLSGAGLFIR